MFWNVFCSFNYFNIFLNQKFCQHKNHSVVQFNFKAKPIYVYVVRGDVNDLLMYLKWIGKHFNERLIIITELIRHLQLLKVIAETLKVRIALDVDLQDDIGDLQKLFYFLDESGEFISEVDERKSDWLFGRYWL